MAASPLDIRRGREFLMNTKRIYRLSRPFRLSVHYVTRYPSTCDFRCQDTLTTSGLEPYRGANISCIILRSVEAYTYQNRMTSSPCRAAYQPSFELIYRQQGSESRHLHQADLGYSSELEKGDSKAGCSFCPGHGRRTWIGLLGRKSGG